MTTEAPPARPAPPPSRTRIPARTAYETLTRAQKPARGVSLYCRYINRGLGRIFAALLASIGLRPNEITILSGIVTGTGIVLLATLRPTWTVGIIVALLLIAGFALDSSDGQVARLTKQSSLVGEWLDHVLDCAKMVTLHAAVLISFYRFQPHATGRLLLPLAWQFVAVVTFFAGILTAELLRRRPSGPPAPRPPSFKHAVALLPADYGVLCCVFFTLGNRSVFEIAYAVLLAINALIFVALLVKWVSEVSEAGRPTE